MCYKLLKYREIFAKWEPQKRQKKFFAILFQFFFWYVNDFFEETVYDDFEINDLFGLHWCFVC